MKNEQLKNIYKTAIAVEKTLKKGVLTKEELEKINQRLDILLADLGNYKRFFKRLM